MIIRYHPSFRDHLRRMSKNKQVLSLEMIKIFRDNPYHPSLLMHRLKRDLSAYWSFSVDDDLRILLSEK